MQIEGIDANISIPYVLLRPAANAGNQSMLMRAICRTFFALFADVALVPCAIIITFLSHLSITSTRFCGLNLRICTGPLVST